jgi:prepilin-type N-terminal cleavage/methylation domain-containing protein
MSIQAGLTLIEVMVAMAILASALSGFLAVFMMNQRTVTAANNQQKAMQQGRAVMEGLFGKTYYHGDLSVGTHAAGSGCSYAVTESNLVKAIAVTVVWTNATQGQASRFVLWSAMAHAVHR